MRTMGRTIPAAAILAAGFLAMTSLPAHAVPGAPAKAAAGAKSGDFNGDGYRDLAVGGPTMDAGTVSRAGAVGVAYGSASGLNTGEHQTISQGSPGVPGGRETGDRFGDAVASGDFDRDGYADLAIGAPGEAVGDTAGAGSLTIVYGSASGLSSRSTSFTQGTGGVPGTAAEDNAFGGHVAAGDVNGDGYADLAVTAAGNDDESARAIVLYGGSGGLTGSGATALAQPPDSDFPPVTGDKRYIGQFGDDVTVADTDKDGKADVFVGLTAGGTEGDNPPTYAGVAYYAGGADGAGATRVKSFDDVGDKLATGDVNGDGTADVVAGSGGGEFSRSVVTLLSGSASGPAKTQQFNQDTEGVPGSNEVGDEFGDAVAVGDVNGDGYADLAVGAYGEYTNDVGKGRLTLFRGGESGVSYSGATSYDQDSTGVPGTGEYADLWGAAVTLADFSGDGKAEMAVGSPGENGTGDLWNRDGDGSVTVFKGTASGPASTGVISFGAATLGGTTAHANFGKPIGQ